MIYEILDDDGAVLNRIVAEEDFVAIAYPGRYRPVPDEAAVAARTVADYVDAMTVLFDTTAQQRRYDNHVTCALRAGYPGPFQAEGMAFAQWMDNCNAKGYSILEQVTAGTLEQPTVSEYLAMLPTLEWPPAVA